MLETARALGEQVEAAHDLEPNVRLLPGVTAPAVDLARTVVSRLHPAGVLSAARDGRKLHARGHARDLLLLVLAPAVDLARTVAPGLTPQVWPPPHETDANFTPAGTPETFLGFHLRMSSPQQWTLPALLPSASTPQVWYPPHETDANFTPAGTPATCPAVFIFESLSLPQQWTSPALLPSASTPQVWYSPHETDANFNLGCRSMAGEWKCRGVREEDEGAHP